MLAGGDWEVAYSTLGKNRRFSWGVELAFSVEGDAWEVEHLLLAGEQYAIVTAWLAEGLNYSGIERDDWGINCFCVYI